MTCVDGKCFLDAKEQCKYIYEVSLFTEENVMPNRYMCKNLKLALLLCIEFVNNEIVNNASVEVPKLFCNEYELDILDPSQIFQNKDTINFIDNITIRQFELISDSFFQEELKPNLPPPIVIPNSPDE